MRLATRDASSIDPRSSAYTRSPTIFLSPSGRSLGVSDSMRPAAPPPRAPPGAGPSRSARPARLQPPRPPRAAAPRRPPARRRTPPRSRRSARAPAPRARRPPSPGGRRAGWGGTRRPAWLPCPAPSDDGIGHLGHRQVALQLPRRDLNAVVRPLLSLQVDVAREDV